MGENLLHTGHWTASLEICGNPVESVRPLVAGGAASGRHWGRHCAARAGQPPSSAPELNITAQQLLIGSWEKQFSSLQKLNVARCYAMAN